MPDFRLNPMVARWLRAEGPTCAEGEPPDWDTWLLRRMSKGEVVDVCGVMVDRAVLHQRFACVSDRCAPGPGRGNNRSCCADAFVALTPAEDERIRRRKDLRTWVEACEPRLASCQGRDFYRQAGEPGLVRPGRRCVFSEMDGQGKIRCHLHAYARHAGVPRDQVQPVSCRLFPLILVDRGQGRVLLTVVGRHTRRLVSAHPVHRYPCLSDPALPPLHQSMRGDLDWLFGAGFAKALAKAV